MKTLIDFAQSRIAWLILAGSAFLLEVIALIFQYGLYLEPCVLCIYQRLAILGLAVAGLIGALGVQYRLIRFLSVILWGISAVLGLKYALQLVDMQTNPAAFANCTFLPDFPTWMPLHEWVPSVFMPGAMCTEEPWVFAGFTMPQWMIAVFGIYCLALVIFIIPSLMKNSASAK